MKKVLAGALIALTTVLIYRSFAEHRSTETVLQENSMLLQEQIKSVSKLIVTEGHFAEVYNYADSKELFGPLVTADKKALVVVNATVIISYDLKDIAFEIDAERKMVELKGIPEPEITINPDFEYYDVSADYFNPFGADDYNLIKQNVNASLLKKVEASTLRSNAQNRLLSELSKLLVLTDSMEWTLTYQEKPVVNVEQLRLFH